MTVSNLKSIRFLDICSMRTKVSWASSLPFLSFQRNATHTSSSSPGLRESQITSSTSDLSYHIIEAGHKGSPFILLPHGFPELAYSWRKVMPSLAKAGYYVVAFD